MNSSAIDALPRSADTAVRAWLLACAGLVLLMVIVGGLTRLTESGLSIVQWQPVAGTLPPMSEAQWQESFAAYQTSPQYAKVNFGMSLEDYKGIFWLEYIHRLLGRVIGLAFFLPWAFFVATRRMNRPQAVRTLAIFALGGMQGLVGWLMVKSGLQDTPAVSPVRLALHLGIAFTILALLLWEVLRMERSQPERPAPGLARLLPVVILLQVVLGALVAGMDAGMVYNSFPSMDGYAVPPDLWLSQLGWRNPVGNPTFAQFIHRLGAYLVVVIVMLAAWRLPTMPRAGEQARWALLGLVFVQFLLGVATLLSQVAISLASLHQTVAALLFASSICLLHYSRFAGAENHVAQGQAA